KETVLYCLLIPSKYRPPRLWPCDEVNRRPENCQVNSGARVYLAFNGSFIVRSAQGLTLFSDTQLTDVVVTK
ncbi:MAG: putative Fe-S cluster-containing MiaB family protein, partial [bacterium]